MKKYIICICVLCFASCWVGRKFITDYYEVTWGDYYTQGSEGYCVGCQIRGETDTIIENVRGIKWNDRIIIVEKNSTDNSRWFAFIANGDILKCGNWDKLIGPLTEYQVDSLINKGNYSDLKEDIFE